MIKYMLMWVAGILPNVYMVNFLFLQVRFYLRFGRFFSREKRVSFNDWIQQDKLKQYQPDYIADKLLCKNFISTKVGTHHTPELLAFGNKSNVADIIDVIKRRGNDKCVLKTTHDASGALIIAGSRMIDVKRFYFNEEVDLSVENISMFLEASWRQSLFPLTRESQYYRLRPRWILEEFVDSGSEISDIKVHCFRGVPKLLYIATDRLKDNKRYLLTTSWERIDGYWSKPAAKSKFACHDLPNRPDNLHNLLELSRLISSDFDYLRVDFLGDGSAEIVGELTFHHASGFDDISANVDSLLVKSLQ